MSGRISFIILVLFAAVIAGFYSMSRPASACELEIEYSDLREPGGEALLAGLSDDCLLKQVADHDLYVAGLVMTMGRSSLLFGHIEETTLLSLLEAEVQSGTRAVFVLDGGLIAALDTVEGDNSERAAALADFALASQAESRVSDASDPNAYWAYRPATLLRRDQITAYCSREDCSEPEALSCSPESPHLKYLAATDSAAFWNEIANCSIEPDFVLSLRRAGLLDGLCSSSLQVNAAMKNGLGPETTCEQLLSHWPHQSFATLDLFAYIGLILPKRGLGEDRIEENSAAILSSFPRLDPTLLKPEVPTDG